MAIQFDPFSFGVATLALVVTVVQLYFPRSRITTSQVDIAPFTSFEISYLIIHKPAPEAQV